MKLITPTIDLETEFRDMLKDWESTGEHKVPFVLNYDTTQFPKYIEKIKGFEKGINIPENFVSHSTFWLWDQKQIFVIVNIRHRLTDHLRIEGGHIGYGIRPSKCNNGYSTRLLKFPLIEARKLGIDRVLVTSDKENIGSVKG